MVTKGNQWQTVINGYQVDIGYYHLPLVTIGYHWLTVVTIG